LRAAREQEARASIETRYGRALTDDEWSASASNVRQLILLLASWDRKRHVVVGAHHEEANDDHHD
jgi:hypothetical protein